MWRIFFPVGKFSFWPSRDQSDRRTRLECPSSRLHSSDTIGGGHSGCLPLVSLHLDRDTRASRRGDARGPAQGGGGGVGWEGKRRRSWPARRSQGRRQPCPAPGGRGAGVYGRAGLQAGRRRAGAGAGARARAPASRAHRAAMRRHAAAAAGSGASGGAAAPALSVSRLSSLDRVDVEREDMAGMSDAQPSTPRGGRGKGARAGAAAGVAKRKRTRHRTEQRYCPRRWAVKGVTGGHTGAPGGRRRKKGVPRAPMVGRGSGAACNAARAHLTRARPRPFCPPAR